ncbi:unnamed protein product [Amaranthus hypochondriacus]
MEVARRSMLRSTDEWVWPPPPRTKNSGLVTNHKGACVCACACAAQILQRHQQQEQHKSQQDIDLYTNDISIFDQSASSKSVIVNNPTPLRFLFCKELTHSDIKKRNKIILPRRDAENHFPYLESRHGIRLYMEDKETSQTWCFRFRYRITNNSKVHSLEGTRQFLLDHDLKAGDFIAIYKDHDRRRFVIGVLKGRREASNVVSTITADSMLIPNLDITSSPSYVYLNQLSDYSIADEMEEAAAPPTPYPYGNATWTGSVLSCQLERLAPLKTFKFFDLPLDYIFWI